MTPLYWPIMVFIEGFVFLPIGKNERRKTEKIIKIGTYISHYKTIICSNHATYWYYAESRWGLPSFSVRPSLPSSASSSSP